MPLQYVRRLSAPERPILRSRRGRAGRLGGPRRPRAPRRCGSARAKAPRSSRRDGAGEAHLLQWAQSMPPAGQARGTLRVLARAREVRGIVPRIRYETVRCVKKRTGALASGAAVLGLYSQPYDARYPVIGRDEQPKPRRGPCTVLAVRGIARPVAHGQRHCAAYGRGLGAPGAGPRGSSARPPGQAPDPGLRPSERPCLRLFYRAFPPAEARRRARRVQRVFTPRHGHWAPQGRTGIARPDAAGPDPAPGTAWAEAHHAAPKGIHWRFRTVDARVRLKHLCPSI